MNKIASTYIISVTLLLTVKRQYKYLLLNNVNDVKLNTNVEKNLTYK